MFTGIIGGIGTLIEVEPSGAGTRLTIDTGEVGAGLAVGDSLSVNGVCLTVAASSPPSVTMDVVPETMRLTNLGALKSGNSVNLERSLRADARLDGHFVLGHVDGVGTIGWLERDEGDVRMEVGCDPALARFIALKGSIAVDGVSLTVTGVRSDGFEVALIPHTLEVTTLGLREAGDAVNVEVDVLARYLERLSETAT